MPQIQAPVSYSNGQTVDAPGFNNHVNGAVILPGLITEQGVLSGSPDVADYFLIYDTSLNALKKIAVGSSNQFINNVQDIIGQNSVRLSIEAGSSQELMLLGSPVSIQGGSFLSEGNNTLGGPAQVNTIEGVTNSITGDTTVVGNFTATAAYSSSAPGNPNALTNKTYVDGVKSLAANGYQKLPGGLVIQWGETATIPQDSATNPITFPTAFNSACVSVVITASTNNGVGSGAQYVNAATARTTGGFNIVNDASASKFSWIALGY